MRSRLTAAAKAALVLFSLLICSLHAAAQSQNTRTPLIQSAVDENTLTTIKGNTHPLARPEFDQGQADTSLPATRMMLVLKRGPDQEAALQQLMAEQQDKSSPNYQKWLTPEQFGHQFGATDQDIQAITTWLASHGLQVTQVSKGRSLIEFSGTIVQVQDAFHTSIHRFTVNGEDHMANASDPQVPAALAPAIQTISGLHNFRPRALSHLTGKFSRAKDTGVITPLLTGSDATGPFYAIGPGDFATIYNVKGLWDAAAPITGTGQKIDIVADSNINPQDIADFRKLFGLPVNPVSVIVNGQDPGLNSDEGEAVLDSEWAGAVAKNATIELVVSEDSITIGEAGIDLSAIYIIDNNSASILSESFGVCEAFTGAAAFYGSIWEQAAAQGISVVVSAGDAGSANCDDFTTAKEASNGLAVNAIASSPFDVAVGGTDFDDAATPTMFFNPTNLPPDPDGSKLRSALSYVPEMAWNDSCAAAGLTGCANLSLTSPGANIRSGSGGPSHFFSKPTFQANAGPPNISGDNARDIPDVSLFAADGDNRNNPSFYVLCQADGVAAGTSCTSGTPNFNFLGVGGTSVAAPAFAGIMALVNQEVALQTGSPRTGNPNFVLYKLAASGSNSCNSSTFPPAGSCIFYDVTKGNDSVPCVGASLNCSATTNGTTGVLVDPTILNTPAWTTGAGYDRATGLGSVNATNLALNWTSILFTPSTAALTINGSSTTVGLPITHGANVNIAVTVSGTGGTPTGDISLLASGAGQPISIDGRSLTGGNVSFQTDELPGGTYSVTAHYAGDANFNPSNSNPVTVSVGRESSITTATFANANGGGLPGGTSVPYGSGILLRVDVTNSASQPCSSAPSPGIPCPTGNLTLTDNGGNLNDFNGSNAAPLNSIGFLEDQTIQLSPGNHSVVAAYAGDNSYTPSTSASRAITITKAVTATTVLPSVITVTAGQPISFTATIATASNGVAPTGSVTFFNGSTSLGTVTVSGSASANGVPASATATLNTTLSFILPPPSLVNPNHFKPVPGIYLLGSALTVLLALILLLRLAPAQRLRGPLVFGSLVLATAFAVMGCGGGGNNAPPPPGTANITAQYTGDGNYSTSTSSVVVVTVH